MSFCIQTLQVVSGRPSVSSYHMVSVGHSPQSAALTPNTLTVKCPYGLLLSAGSAGRYCKRGNRRCDCIRCLVFLVRYHTTNTLFSRQESDKPKPQLAKTSFPSINKWWRASSGICLDHSFSLFRNALEVQQIHTQKHNRRIGLVKSLVSGVQ